MFQNVLNFKSLKMSPIPTKVRFRWLWQVGHFFVWVFFKFIITKEPNNGNYRHIHIFLERKIYAYTFCSWALEETPNEKVINMSKLTKSYLKVMLYEKKQYMKRHLLTKIRCDSFNKLIQVTTKSTVCKTHSTRNYGS